MASPIRSRQAGARQGQWATLRVIGACPGVAFHIARTNYRDKSDVCEKLLGVLVKIEPAQLHARKIRHLEALKSQIARCLEEEVNLLAEERQERARQLGIDWKIAEQPAERRRSR